MRSFTSQSDFDVYIIVETWLNKDFSDGEIVDLNRYQIFRKDRDPIKTGHLLGGGLLIAVNRSLNSQIHNLSNRDTILDQLCVSIAGPQGLLFICISYVPPDSSEMLYKMHVDNVLDLSKTASDTSAIFVVGDFNLPKLTWSYIPGVDSMLIPGNINKPYEINLIDSFFGLNLSQINNFHNRLGRILDLMFISDDLMYSTERCFFPMCNSDMHHVPLVIELEFYSFDNMNTNTTASFNYKLGNFAAINDVIKSINWNDLFSNFNDLSDSYDAFLQEIIKICEIYVPKFKPRIHKLPWYTKGLKKLKNLRNKHYNEFKLSKDVESERLYKHYMREFNVLDKFLYKQYMINIEQSIKLDPKSFWNFVKSRKGKSSVPLSVFYGDSSSDNLRDSTELFANFFRSSYEACSLEIDDYDLSNINSFGEFGSLVISEDDIINGISNLKCKMGIDDDGFSSFFIKKCITSISVPLLNLFNSSLRSGDFIDKWKRTSITPVFKSGNKCDVGNYRPISKISTISKLFEQIVCSKLNFFVRPIISQNQHGFVCGRSTVTNLAIFTHYCIDAFEKRKQVDTIYTDFSKAFDRISHAILLAKLEKLGFHSIFLKWMRSYLINRLCSVRLDGVNSAPFVATSGVPQGSVFGPLLFNLYINDISSCFLNSEFLLYADDLKIFKTISSFSDCLLLQKDLDSLSLWSYRNKLQFNIEKCFQISFYRTYSVIINKYSIISSFLNSVDEILDLGVVFDLKLTFVNHINYILPKAYSLMAFVRRNCNEFQDPYTRKVLYTSIVRSTLDYASFIWSPYCVTHINRVERIQRKFIKFALGSIEFIDPIPSYSSKCALIGLETLENRRSFQAISLLYDIINCNIDCSFLLSLVNWNVPLMSLRQQDYFYNNVHRTNYATNQPLIRVQNLCNKLVGKIEVSTSLSLEFTLPKEVFKNIVKIMLSKVI